MNTFISRTLVLLTLAVTALQAQVPQLINYEGRVAVHGVNFDGPGKFKFAIVDAAGTTSFWSNDGTSTAGSEPAAAVKLTVTRGLYSVLLGDPALPNMAAIPEGIFKNSGILLRVWFNDGTNGSQLLAPDQSLPMPVDAMPVRAGNARDIIPLPTEAWQQRHAGAPAPAARSNHTSVWTGSEMIVWGGRYGDGSIHYLNDGGRYNPAVNNWTSVSTDGAPAGRQYHTAVWNTLQNDMIVWGGDNGGTLNDGGRYNPASNSWTPIPGTLPNTPGARYHHTAVWTGVEMIVWGGIYLLPNGYDIAYFSGARYNPSGNVWFGLNNNGAPRARYDHTAVWTGSDMIVWGGNYFLLPTSNGGRGYLNDGGRYNWATDTWNPVNSIGAPSERARHTAVWTGSEMIVWGGQAGTGRNDGGRYNPAGFGTWSEVTTTGAPSGRHGHTAVWNAAGNEMIVWGGYYFDIFKDGGRYTPGGGWTPVNLNGAPTARGAHTAVWTGSEMIVWGGSDYPSAFNDGGRYNPAGNSWAAVTTGAPAARFRHTAVWTGSELIVWGGDNGFYLNTGGCYSPAVHNWTTVNPDGAPSGRSKHTAVWTGSEMIIWGGTNGAVPLNDGGRYNRAGNTWAPVSLSGAPAARDSHTAVWTDSEMIVWGGDDGSGVRNDGGRYTPGGGWMAVPTAGAPAGRKSHTAVWNPAGSEMIVWGGIGADFFNDGGRYTPGGGWTPVNSAGAPAGRLDHTAVWTGSEMIVWGGLAISYLNDGGRYTPGGGWTPVPTAGAPAARNLHTAVWTGREMIIWGGDNGNAHFNTGGRFTPAENSWTPVTTTGAPAARYGHTAVWNNAGGEMIVWGGSNGSILFNDTFSYTFTPAPPGTGFVPITNLVLSGGNLTMSFSTVRNRSYILWSSDTLAAGSWTNTGLTTSGNGATRTFTVPAPVPGVPKRFFLVQDSP